MYNHTLQPRSDADEHCHFSAYCWLSSACVLLIANLSNPLQREWHCAEIGELMGLKDVVQNTWNETLPSQLWLCKKERSSRTKAVGSTIVTGSFINPLHTSIWTHVRTLGWAVPTGDLEVFNFEHLVSGPNQWVLWTNFRDCKPF